MWSFFYHFSSDSFISLQLSIVLFLVAISRPSYILTASRLTIIPRTSMFAPPCITCSRSLPCHHFPPQLRFNHISPYNYPKNFYMHLPALPAPKLFLVAIFHPSYFWPHLTLPFSQELLHLHLPALPAPELFLVTISESHPSYFWPHLALPLSQELLHLHLPAFYFDRISPYHYLKNVYICTCQLLSTLTAPRLTIISRTSTFSSTTLTASPLIIIPRISTFAPTYFLLWPHLPLPLSQERLHLYPPAFYFDCISPYHYPKNVYIYTDPDLSAFYFDPINHSMWLVFVITSLLTPLFPPQRRAFLFTIFPSYFLKLRLGLCVSPNSWPRLCVGQPLIGLGLCVCPVVDRLDFASSIWFFLGSRLQERPDFPHTVLSKILFRLYQLDDLFCQWRLQHSLSWCVCLFFMFVFSLFVLTRVF